jgi:pyrimidine-nucleoside phosphorylase
MGDRDKARKLAVELCEVGNELGLPVRALITNMEQPLGRFIGNALEVRESIECLQGRGPSDLRELTLELAAEMLALAKLQPDVPSARERATRELDSGNAYVRFLEMVRAQGGDPNAIENPEKLPGSIHSSNIDAPKDGYITSMNCREIGNAAVVLGAGRAKTTDAVDHGVGLEICVALGSKVAKGDPLAVIHYNDEQRHVQCRTRLEKAITIADRPPESLPLIMECLG